MVKVLQHFFCSTFFKGNHGTGLYLKLFTLYTVLDRDHRYISVPDTDLEKVQHFCDEVQHFCIWYRNIRKTKKTGGKISCIALNCIR